MVPILIMTWVWPWLTVLGSMVIVIVYTLHVCGPLAVQLFIVH